MALRDSFRRMRLALSSCRAFGSGVYDTLGRRQVRGLSSVRFWALRVRGRAERGAGFAAAAGLDFCLERVLERGAGFAFAMGSYALCVLDKTGLILRSRTMCSYWYSYLASSLCLLPLV